MMNFLGLRLTFAIFAMPGGMTALKRGILTRAQIKHYVGLLKIFHMGNKLMRCAVFAGLLALLACGGNKPAERGWRLVWEENFDRAELDEAVWSKISRGVADWRNYMSDFDSCFTLRDGLLVLRGIVNSSEPNDTAPYLTGGVYTKGKLSFADGRMEVRARLGGAKGAWPAIWMLPQGSHRWPLGGEIDIMERLNGDSIAYQTVHTHYTYNHGYKDNPQSSAVGPIDPDGFNTYAVELHRDSLVFFINGVRTFAYPRIETSVKGQFPFASNRYYLLLDMQLGGNWVGDVDPADLPVEMEVDWVRFYQR